MGDNTTYIAGSTPTYTITHEDGSVVTPQEVYDAFMSGPVILEITTDGGGTAETVRSLYYEGTPDNIMGCIIETHRSKVQLVGE